MTTSTILPVIHPIEGELHADSLARLHTALVDAREGQEAFRERADPGTAPMLDAFRDLHARHDRELAVAMGHHGHPPDEGGSFMSYVHGGMARLRDMFGDVDAGIVPQVLDGERHVIEAYNEALRRGQPADVNELLQRQREELAALVVRHDPDASTEGAHPG